MFALLACLGLGGCATIIEGDTQTLLVETEPVGATCRLFRNEELIRYVAATPEGFLVKKNIFFIRVECKKRGYQMAESFIESEGSPTTGLNFILGGSIGRAIDAESGADRKYKDRVLLRMQPAKGDGDLPEAPPAILPPEVLPADRRPPQPKSGPTPALTPLATSSTRTQNSAQTVTSAVVDPGGQQPAPPATQNRPSAQVAVAPTPPAPVPAAPASAALAVRPGVNDPLPPAAQQAPPSPPFPSGGPGRPAPKQPVPAELRLKSLNAMLVRFAITQDDYDRKVSAIQAGQ